MEAARRGRGYAENAAQLGAMLGRLDDAFSILEAYYFGSELAGRPAFSEEQGEFWPERRTAFLFAPITVLLRADARFERLMDRIGLKAYWAAAKHLPDYLARGGG
jgi:hypothetical protein